MYKRQLFAKYFYDINEEQAREWISSLAVEWHVRSLSDLEMCDVIMNMIKDKDCPRKPNLRDILHGIVNYRKSKRRIAEEFSNLKMSTCRYCGGSGSLVFNAEIRNGNAVWDTIAIVKEGCIIHGHASCPCGCERGEKLQKQMNADDRLRKRVLQLHREAVLN